MRTLWISLCVTLIIALVEAQKNLNIPKPSGALEKRSGPPIWRRPPEERRKLSLFPKNNKKFVVTERTTLKTEVTKPMVTTKRPLLRKLFVQDKIDQRKWSFPAREPMIKPKQFAPVAPHPKRNYNKHYKAKAQDVIAEPSTKKTVVTNVNAEKSTHKVQLNRVNVIQLLNKINAYTNKSLSRQTNKLFKKPGTDASGSIKQNMVAAKINEQVDKATEKVFLSKPVDQNNKQLKTSSLDNISEVYDYESSEANVTQTINEQLNKTAVKVFLSKQVGNVTQNNELFNAISPNVVSEENINENDYENRNTNVTKITINQQLKKTDKKIFLSRQVDNETHNSKTLNTSSLDTVSEKYADESSEVNMIQIAINEKLNKTAEKVFLSKQVDNVTQNNEFFNASSPNVVSEEYIDKKDYDKSEANVTKTTINDQLNKTAENFFLNNQVNNETRNNKSLNDNALDTVSKKYADESSEVNVIQIAINEQLNKTAENDFLSKNVDNTMQNNKSLNASLLDIVSEKYVDGNSEANETHTTISEKVNETTQKVFLSIQISNFSQNTNLFKVNEPDNVSDEYLVHESDLHVIPATPTKIIKKQENESTLIHNTFTEEPVSHSEPLEGRSLDTNDLDLNNQNNSIIFQMNDNLNFDEKAENLSKLDKFDILMRVITKDASDYKDHELSIDSNNAKSFTVSIHDINEKTVNSNPQKFEEISNNFYEINPVIRIEYKNNISTDNNIEDSEIQITENYENRNIEIKSDYTNTERSSVNKINDLENLIEVIKSNTTSLESTADNADSLSKFDLNIVEEYSDRPNTISARYDQTTLEPYLHESLSDSPIEITFDNLKTVSAEGKPEESIFMKPVVVVIDQDTADQIIENVFSMNNDSVTEITESIDNGNTIFSGITNVNTDENGNNINENSSVVDNLHNLVEIIKDKSAVGYDSEVAIGETQLVNLDMNIVEEYSNKPIVITTELDGITQAFYFSDASLTETPIEILSGSQEALNTNFVQPVSNENIQKIMNKSIINDLSKTGEIFSTTNNPTTEVSFNIGEVNTYIKDKSEVGYGNEIAIGETQLVNLDMNIVEEYSDKPIVITTELDKTTQAFILSDGSLTESLIEILSDSQEAHNTEKVSVQPVFNEYVHKTINKSVNNDLRKTDEIFSTAIDPTTKFSFNIGEGNTYIKDKPEVWYGNEKAIGETQLVNLDMNIVKEYNDKPIVITTDLDETTQAFILSDGSLTESLIEILSDSRKAHNTEKVSVQPVFNENVKIINKSGINDLNKTDEIFSTTNDPMSEVLFDIGEEYTYIKDKSMIGYGNEIATGETLLGNLDMNIFEEYSDNPIIVTTELDETTQANILSNGSLNGSSIEILSDIQEALNTDKVSVQPVFHENVHKIIDKSVINELSKTDEIFSMTNNSTTEVSLNIGDGIEISNIEQSSSENNKNNILVISLPNLDELLNNNLIVSYDIEEAISEIELSNGHINIVDDDIYNPHVITVAVDQTPGTKKDYIESEHEMDVTSKGIFVNHREPSSTDISFDVYTNKRTDEPMTNQLNTTDEINTKVEDSVKKNSPNVEETNTTNQTENSTYDINYYKLNVSSNLANFSTDNEDLNFGYTTEVSITATQLLINITKANSEKPNAIAIVLDGTTQKSYLNGEYVDHAPTGILEPLSSNNEYLNMPITAIFKESVTSQPSPNDNDIQQTEKLIDLPDTDISDEWMATSSMVNQLNENSSKSNYLKAKGVLNNLNIVDEEISSELFMDNSINSSDTISNKPSVVANDSSSTLEEMFEIMIAQADQFRNLSDEISDVSYVLNDSSVIIQENISEEMTADQSKNLTDGTVTESSVSSDNSSSIITTDEISNESYILNDNSSTIVTQEEVSDEMAADQPKNLTDEISNESYTLIDSSSNIATQKEVSDEMAADQPINLTDEISNESYTLIDSSSNISTQEEVSDETTADQPKNLTDEILNESSYVLNDSSSNIATQEEVSDETTVDQPKNLTDEIPNESYVLNDSSSDIATQEEVSDKTTADQPKNLTDEIPNESYVLSDSSSGILTTEDIFYEITSNESENLTKEVSNESHILNDSSTTIEEIIDDLSDDKLEYLTGEISNESFILAIHTSDKKSEELTEESKNVSGDDVSNESLIDILHPNTELAANDKLVSRNKRSNNIIEEENLATTLSSFKYTGHGSRLGHDLRFKNINA